jgi:hypothetical protein
MKNAVKKGVSAVFGGEKPGVYGGHIGVGNGEK